MPRSIICRIISELSETDNWDGYWIVDASHFRGLIAVWCTDTFAQSAVGTRYVTVSVNLKSAKSPADNGRNKFRPLATDGGYVLRCSCRQYKYLLARCAHIRLGTFHTFPSPYICAYVRARMHEMKKSARIYSAKSRQVRKYISRL